MPDPSAIVSKVWNYAHVLKNAGIGYGDYVEQHQIVAGVEVRNTALDHLEAKLNHQIARFDRLRQSTRSATFSGTLT